MRSMTFTSALLAASLSFGLSAQVRAPDQTVEAKLKGDAARLLAHGRKDGRIKVSVIMRDQADRAEGERAAAVRDKGVRRREMVSILKDAAALSQRDLIEWLAWPNSRGEIGARVQSFWLHSIVVLEAGPEVVRAIAARDDVASIHAIEHHPRPVALAGAAAAPAVPAGSFNCGLLSIGAPDVWNDFGLTGDGVTIGIIDTGCCLTHPDLADQVWVNIDEIPGNGVDDDGNGFIDDAHGWSFWTNSGDVTDFFGHGTMVSGLACGDGANGTLTGVAPDAAFITLQFSGANDSAPEVWAAMQYCIDNGADVINASIGFPHFLDPDRAAWRAVCENAIATGMILIFAAGNEGNTAPPVDNVRTPGDVPHIITAGATMCSDELAGFTSRGPVTWEDVPPYNDWPYPPGKMKCTVSAPGQGVATTSINDGCTGYENFWGTSAATPHISGTVALMLQANPDLDHFDAKRILIETAVDLGDPGWDNDFGAGRIDAVAAVEAAADAIDDARLTGFEIVTGAHLGGNIDDLRVSEDSAVAVRSGFGASLVDLHHMETEIAAVTTAANPQTIDLEIEARISEPAGTGQVRLFNHTSGAFDLVDTHIVSSTDSVIAIADIPARDYIAGGGEIALRIKHIVFVPFVAFTFESRLDWVEMAVE